MESGGLYQQFTKKDFDLGLKISTAIKLFQDHTTLALLYI